MSTLRDGDKFQLYEISEELIFQIVYEEMHKQTKHEVIRAVDGPERGYTVRFYPGLGLDHYDVTIKIIPVSGVDTEGKTKRGYYAQLIGGGTYPSGKPTQIMRNIESRLDREGSPVNVTKIKKTNYVWDRDRWRLNDSPSAREINDSTSATDRLRELKKIFEEGIISQDEYDNKKAKILENF